MAPSYSFGGIRKSAGMVPPGPDATGFDNESRNMKHSASAANLSRASPPRKISPGPGEYDINRDKLGGKNGYGFGNPSKPISTKLAPGPG